MIENKYGIRTKTDSSGNPHAKTITERIHQVLVNLVWTYNIQETYVDDPATWMGVLAASVFTV